MQSISADLTVVPIWYIENCAVFGPPCTRLHIGRYYVDNFFNVKQRKITEIG